MIGGCEHKRHALNTQLSSGTSAETFACPAGSYRNCRGEAGTKNGPNWYFVPLQKKRSESRSSRFEPKISLIYFLRDSGPPLTEFFSESQERKTLLIGFSLEWGGTTRSLYNDVLVVREINCGSWLAREYMPAHQQCGLFNPLDCGEVQGLF